LRGGITPLRLPGRERLARAAAFGAVAAGGRRLGGRACGAGARWRSI